MMPLDAETINLLLKGELEKAANGDTKGLPRPVQLGPLRWYDTTEHCASRGCTSPTYIMVRGVRYCTTHALNVLNEIILRELEHQPVDDCTCDAGKHSKYNVHTYNCALVSLTKAPQVVPELELL